MAEKNIAAFLRDDAKTITVRFINDKFKGERSNETLLGVDWELSPIAYTYVTDLDFAKGDLAIVYAVGVLKVVLVEEVHDGVEIEPNDSTHYKWVVSKLDMAPYMANIKKNSEITSTVTHAYKQNLKQQFRSVVLANISEEAKAKLLNIMNPQVEGEQQ
jgi:hypothetical protein